MVWNLFSAPPLIRYLKWCDDDGKGLRVGNCTRSTCIVTQQWLACVHVCVRVRVCTLVLFSDVIHHAFLRWSLSLA